MHSLFCLLVCYLPPHVFTKMMWPLVRLWHGVARALRQWYDGVCALQNEDEVIAASNWVRDMLSKAGWMYNKAKSVWAPTHKLQWFGSGARLRVCSTDNQYMHGWNSGCG